MLSRIGETVTPLLPSVTRRLRVFSWLHKQPTLSRDGRRNLGFGNAASVALPQQGER